MSRFPAPTRRLGDDRRRSFLLALSCLAIVLCLAGCAGPWPIERSPIPAMPIGGVIEHADGRGPDIECRGVTRDRCERAGSIEDLVVGIAWTDVERVIVSCEGAPCTPEGGALRVDVVLRDGTTAEVARGGYGDFRQP